MKIWFDTLTLRENNSKLQQIVSHRLENTQVLFRRSDEQMFTFFLCVKWKKTTIENEHRLIIIFNNIKPDERRSKIMHLKRVQHKWKKINKQTELTSTVFELGRGKEVFCSIFLWYGDVKWTWSRHLFWQTV